MSISGGAVLKSAVLLNLVSLPLLAPNVLAQGGTITGHVYVAETRAPVDGVSITINGTPLFTLSSTNGGFTLLDVPPGTYTVTARAVGFSTVEVTGVVVEIGRTNTLTFALSSTRTGTTTQIAATPPPIDPKAVGSLISIDRTRVLDIPSITLPAALALNSGYVLLPRSTSNLSLSDVRRGISVIPSVRSGRAEATHYLLDGFDVSNPVFGYVPLLAEPLALASVSFAPAFANAEYGAALSGLVNQALRTGGDNLEGAFEYQTSMLAGALGSSASGATNANAMRGYLAGPVPLAEKQLHFAISGHSNGDRLGVVKAGNEDWHGSGDTKNDQVAGKLTYDIGPQLRLSVSGVGQSRTSMDVDHEFISGDSVAPGTMREDVRFLSARLEKRFLRSNISVAYADTRSKRETCSIWEGVCVEDRLQRIPIDYEVPAFGRPPIATPYAISGQFFGGETYRTRAFRADIAMQASDHNRVKFGLYGTQHDITYEGVAGYRWLQGVLLNVRDLYRAHPVEFATYFQDVIEHDLITVNFGARFDYGYSGGYAFANPLSPTNGTTAREVCMGQAPGLNETPFTFGDLTGLAACLAAPTDASGRSVLVDSAKRIAAQDDFRPVERRVAFSPRIALSMPITETSALYVNYARYNRNPVYQDAFRNTGIGTHAGMDEGTDKLCEATYVRRGSNECLPNVSMPYILPDFLGNPNLPFVTGDIWEFGFTSRVGEFRSIDAAFFSNTQFNLASVYRQQQESVDIGLTYGAQTDNDARIALPRGNSATLGFSITLRQPQRGPFSYSVNYTWQRSYETGARPDLTVESLVALEGGVNNTIEHTTTRNRPHAVNAQFNMKFREAPAGTRRIGRIVLGRSHFAATVSAATGSESRLNKNSCAFERECAAYVIPTSGTANLVNVMYSKSLTTGSPQWAFVVRGLNVFNGDDGASDIIRSAFLRGGPAAQNVSQQIARRRVLSGFSVNF